jgi:Flp pilus assembly protein TadG
MRRDGLLKLHTNEHGSAIVQSIFAIVLLMTLVLGVLQISLSLYARNALSSAAHEGARRALELGASAEEARALVARTVESSTGGLVHDLDVATNVTSSGRNSIVQVRVTGTAPPLGPVPVTMNIDARASASREIAP